MRRPEALVGQLGGMVLWLLMRRKVGVLLGSFQRVLGRLPEWSTGRRSGGALGAVVVSGNG